MSAELRVPDAISPVRAWRLWQVDDEGVAHSPNRAMTWATGWLTAQCTTAAWAAAHRLLHGEDGRVPSTACHCGFYGLARPGDAVTRGAAAAACATSGWGWGRKLVLGVVEFAGRCLEHESGWRAEHARIAGFVPDPTVDARVRAACERYDAERITLHDRDVFAAAIDLESRRERMTRWTLDHSPASGTSKYPSYHAMPGRAIDTPLRRGVGGEPRELPLVRAAALVERVVTQPV